MARLTPLLLVLWVGVTASTVVDLQKRIIGGQTCAANERQFHVKLTDGNNRFMCGGSLISGQWVLTAGHCKDPTLKAVLGAHPGPGTPVKITAQKVFKDINGPHDIMLLKLEKSTKGPTVNLPDCGNIPTVGQTVQIAGHAATTTGPRNKKICAESPTLQCAQTTVVDCQPLINQMRMNPAQNAARLYQNWFCYQDAQVETCPGDSGGGVVYNGMIYGVHVAAPRTAFTGPGRFMNVCAYIDWITDTIGKPKSIFAKLKCTWCFSP